MNPLFKYFAKRIVIDLYPSKFIFSIKEEDINISFAPFIYLVEEESKQVPIAIGEEVPSEERANPNIHRISLNDLENRLPSDAVMNREAFLQLLFEYGIGRCFERYWFPQLRPVVFIVGASRFSNYFENPRDEFAKAAKRGGAKIIIFDRIEL